ncbi:1-hydroxycarotenoid 3,4-desaturase CrtD [Plastoroseomonas arctica]|uniref:Phytoene desaturase n=1 Tax=Plastoroseomonas arctica TaxID=1509237 RepID=A0AAF1JVH4_9PROT|nr:1-hydroxycarotenoid 3,4-desaturase CrtD [Plastoroseomonas arctica]MBR0654032.1 phytoene desaturase [Plastoroseomonas arctica]
MPWHPKTIAIIGAGMGGLAAAIDLAGRGVAVTLLESAPGPGGKVSETRLPTATLDSGASAITLRWVFDALFDEAGSSLDAHVTLEPAALLARHSWGPGAHLDLFADPKASADAIGAFAGPAEARGYLVFVERARRTYAALEQHYIRAQRPTAMGLMAKAGVTRLLATSPFATLWDALGDHFADPRLRQLFARYASYVGSSPLLAPATLMLVADVERQGVWRIRGGIMRLVEAMAALAAEAGATLRYGAEVTDIRVEQGRAAGVVLAGGEQIAADAVIANADAAAIGAGRLGDAAARAVPALPANRRSFSAITWAMHTRTSGFPLARESVFLAPDPTAEFAQIHHRGRLPAISSVHLSAPDRDDSGAAPDGPERLLALVSAPAREDQRPLDAAAIAACGDAAFARLRACGLDLDATPEQARITTPADFARRYPGTGGALYGQAVHGWQATFQRPGARTALPGFLLAGGGTHPGAGVAMAALSGRLAAAAALEDRP